MSRKTKTEKEKEMELRQAKREAKKAAKELGYLSKFKDVEEKIKNAASVIEVDRIMTTCRRAS